MDQTAPTQTSLPKRHKNRVLAVFLAALFPGLGYFYLGLGKKGLKTIGIAVGILVAQFIVAFLFFSFVSLPEGISGLISTVLSIPFWTFFLLQVRGAYLKTAEVNNSGQVNTAPENIKYTGAESLGTFSSLNKVEEKMKVVVERVLQEDKVPEEVLLDFFMVQERPSGWYFLLLGGFYVLLAKGYILISTNKRLLLVEMGARNEPVSRVSYPLSQLTFSEFFSRSLVTSNLVLIFPDGKKRKFTSIKARYGKRLQAIGENISHKSAATIATPFQVPPVPSVQPQTPSVTCPKCSKPLSPNQAFCNQCGNKTSAL